MFEKCQFVDLTHTLCPEVPSWTGGCGFSMNIKMDYPQGCRVHSFRMLAGLGTHMDAPLHFYGDNTDIASIPLEALIRPLVVVDVSKKAHGDFFVDLDDLPSFIPLKSFVAFYTGWQAFWGNTDKYRNVGLDGKMHFPGVSAEVIEKLLEHKCVGIGIDTLSPDGSNMSFPVHHLLLKAGGYIVENMNNLDQMPPSGGWVINLPIKIKDGSEAPIRSVGIINSCCQQ